MDKNIFSGLEGLGFEDTDKIDLYNKKEDEKKQQSKQKKVENPLDMLYDAEVTCPVCGTKFKSKCLKTNVSRVVSKDSDLFMKYDKMPPYFYEVWLCNVCGYAAMKSDFFKLRDSQKEEIQLKISNKWHGKKYPEIYDVDIAIERYKLALLNYFVINAKASKKAMTCLKLGWMYRIKEDSTNELIFLKQSLQGFNDAFISEDFPLYGMDKFTVMYLIAELYRRTGDNNTSMSWFSKVITSPGVPQKIKEMSIDQKEEIKRAEIRIKEENSSNEDANDEPEEKKGFFSKLFK